MKVLTTVRELCDPYFGRRISIEPEEIFKALIYYAKKQGPTKFDYEDWFGSCRSVTFRISRVILTNYSCFVEIEGADIPKRYVPSPRDLIGNVYLCNSHERDFYPNESVIKEEII